MVDVKRAGLVGAAIGVVAAGAAAGVAIERVTVGRGVRRKARLALDAAGSYGGLRGTPGTAVAEDGTELYFEIDEVEVPAEPQRPKRGWLRGGRGRQAPLPVTVVFSHGYCLSQDAWHFQRAALRGAVRTVFWDQRSHGRSEHGHDQADGKPVSIDQLGRDLKAVLDAAVPEGPVVLVGHSMGGMTVMAFADQFHAYVAERVAGVAFVSTSAGKLAAVTFGLPAAGARAFRAVAPGVLRMLGSQVDLVERTRRATADLFAGIIKRYSFGADDVDPVVARFAERLIEATPIDVVAEFYPAFTEHEKADALAVLEGLPGLVLAGDKDLLTPSAHSTEIAERLPEAELVLVPGAGHLVLMERPEVVNAALARVIAEAADTVSAPVPSRLRELTGTVDA
ncbi:alpha/beta fold hydrolase [Actinacidiphila rubida]|uniref:Pimeloyl-ACP methyl ester carboxylesterase n=1 Tax=Actinacidiphila rubida TaxID=310780 RepID=A0A1H8MJA3_9ACTN|nr:alpha/beta hydrolase [Actinacidiphila rubida]SEO17226.1 Pimeloyl-ACP methyl ester carboxylesterase [Actinacidiphila rubida]